VGASVSAPLCLTCKHCCLDFGSPDYSELTPGESAYIACERSLFPEPERHFVDLMRLSQGRFVKLIRTAETCEQYEESKG
jgi:hypothetical protein